MNKTAGTGKMIFVLVLLLSFFVATGVVAAAPDAQALPRTDTQQRAQIKLPTAVRALGDDGAAGVELLGAKFAVHNDAASEGKLRLVIDSSAPVRVSAQTADTPAPRLVVTIAGAELGNLPEKMMLDGKIAEQASFNRLDNSSVQLVIDVPLALSRADYKVFTLAENKEANRPFRVVVDISRLMPKMKYSFSAGLRNKVIVLDPGHGGSDPGAIGPGGTREKAVTLAVAMQVKSLLEASGAKVIMTRRTDVDVAGINASDRDELGARAAVGNQNKADVFVSIHANSFTNPLVNGVGTYYFPKSEYDAVLAERIQRELAANSGLEDKGIRTANFFVVKRTWMPAVLLELGFLSNPQEEKLLITPAMQQRMAKGIVRGLDGFFQAAAQRSGGGR